MDEHEDLIDAVSPVAAALHRLGVPHYIGGSVASSFHGATRSTMDVDLVCDLEDQHVSQFIQLVGDKFYVSEPAVREAINRKQCFNLIHLPTSFKVDVFVSRRRAFDLEAMQRASPQRLGLGRQIEIPIATPEDSIISKLEWYRMANETSERQWNDVTRLRDILGEKVDRDYLQRAAKSVGVEALLTRLMEGK